MGYGAFWAMANAGGGSKGDPKALQAISQGVRSLASELETRPEKRANGLAGTHEPSSYGIVVPFWK